MARCWTHLAMAWIDNAADHGKKMKPENFTALLIVLIVVIRYYG